MLYVWQLIKIVFCSCRETNKLFNKKKSPPPTENQMVRLRQATDSQVNYLLECTICIYNLL